MTDQDVADATAVDDGTDADVPVDPASPPPRRWLRRLRWAALWTSVVVVTLSLVATTVLVWTVRRGFPTYEGELTLPGLGAPVTVYRDSFGIPQVFASSEHDLFEAQGYLHAQDRFWEMDVRRHLTSGRLAELFGPSQVPADAFLRTLGLRRVAEQEWSLLSPSSRDYLTAYAAGVNAWIADNGDTVPDGQKSLEYVILGLRNSTYTVENWDPIDSIAWLKAMAWDLRGNMDEEVARASLLAQGLSREQIDQLYRPYPFDRNRPIIMNGTVRNGAFVAGGPDRAEPVRTAPARSRRITGSDRAIRAQAPVLAALGEAMRAIPDRLGVSGTGLGSNSWVVSGALTASGKPLLANDPHLSPSVPGIWYQVGLHCSCPYNVEGFSLSGMPGIIIGHNARVAWGLTNLGADVTDLYIEKINGGRYFDGTAWRDLATRTETIKVAGGQPVSITVRATRHGPLVSDRSDDLFRIARQPPVDPAGSPLSDVIPGANGSGAGPGLDTGAAGVPAPATATPYGIALRWTALNPGRSIDALFGIDQAADWDQFRAAASLFDSPVQNVVYADVDGNIGYQTLGRIPIRGKGDGRWSVPGWDPAYDWTGDIPFAERPFEFNPPGGVIVAANQAVTGPQYPYLITGDWTNGYRSQRIFDLLGLAAHGTLSVADMRRIQFDNYNGFAPVLVPALLAAPLPAGPDNRFARARELLRGWDFQQPADAPAASAAAAAFYNATLRHLLVRTFDETPEHEKPGSDDFSWEILRWLLATPTSPWWDDRSTTRVESMNDILAAAMQDAAVELTDRLGPDPTAWRWGRLHTLTLVNDTLGRSGIAPIERVFNRGPIAVSGGGGVVNATSWLADAGYQVAFVPSMRMIVDMSNLDGSRWVQLTGDSGHAYHANYTDQVELWRTGNDLPMRWSRPAIEAAARHTLTLQPGPPR
jgi:penicillin G amidase